MRDTIFTDPTRGERPFVFDAAVSTAFDDMATRSIPYYAELQLATCSLCLEFATPGSTVIDVGCSTGTLFQLIAPRLAARNVKLIGIDSSADMIARAQEKLREFMQFISWQQSEAQDAEFPAAQIIIMNYTLQFVPLQHRPRVLRQIRESLDPKGALIMSEKISFDCAATQSRYDSLYYQFKRRNGYSDEEIEAKRRALEGVLVPQTLENHYNALTEAGFQLPEIFLQGYQFVSMLVLPRT